MCFFRFSYLYISFYYNIKDMKCKKILSCIMKDEGKFCEQRFYFIEYVISDLKSITPTLCFVLMKAPYHT